IDQNSPRIRRHQTDNHVKARGFTRPVRAQQTHYFPLIDVESDPVHYPSTPVGFAYLVGRKRLLHHFLNRVCVMDVELLLSTSTLLSRLKKVNETPVTWPCSASKMLGGMPGNAVRTNFPSSAIYRR